MANRILLKSVLKHDLTSFIQRTAQTVAPHERYMHNWHIDVIAWHLQQCLNGEITRLIINLPPRHLKSICASVAFPAYVLGHDPRARIVVASYANELATKLAIDCRSVMRSPWYREAFPKTRIDRDKDTELEFMTTARGFRLGTSVGGALTGRGGNFIVLDDPLKPTDAMSNVKRDAANQWFRNTLYSRLDNKAEDRIIIVSQRLHVDDLVGHVLADEPWVLVSIPAIAETPQRYQFGLDEFIERQVGDVLHPEREPQGVLERIKATLGTYNFNAQYQQNPVPPEGALIKWRWFQFYLVLPPKGPDDRIIQSWDTASKDGEFNDYSVCQTWRESGSEFYLVDVFRERLDYPNLKRRVVELANHQGADVVLIEDRSSGTHLIQELKLESRLTIIGIEPREDKQTRMFAQCAKLEAGQVYLPEDAAWLQDFQTEILQFPRGRHDDQVDAMSQFLGWISDRPPPIECW